MIITEEKNSFFAFICCNLLLLNDFIVFELVSPTKEFFLPNDMWYKWCVTLIEFILIQILGQNSKYLCVFKTSDLLIYYTRSFTNYGVLALASNGFMHVTWNIARDNGIWRMYLLCISLSLCVLFCVVLCCVSCCVCNAHFCYVYTIQSAFVAKCEVRRIER